MWRAGVTAGVTVQMAKRRKPRNKIVSAKGEARGVGTASAIGASTAAGTGHAAGKGDAVGVSEAALQPGAFQGLPPSAAVRSTAGETKPPEVPPGAGFRAPLPIPLGLGAGETVVSHVPASASVPITPTVYPDSPQGTIIVQNYVTINVETNEFIQFNKNLEALIGELRLSNEISGEVRDKLISELHAGRELLTGPKPQRGVIEVLLVRPLKWIMEKSGSAIIGKLAGDALNWLLKMIL
jgi:hypothetical protein